jgi:tetratricopeptide (TPR) repeat protein
MVVPLPVVHIRRVTGIFAGCAECPPRLRCLRRGNQPRAEAAGPSHSRETRARANLCPRRPHGDLLALVNQEALMRNLTAQRVGLLAAVALLGFAVSIGRVLAAGGDAEPRNPPQPPVTDKKTDQKSTSKKKPDKKSEQEFLDGYRAARALVLDGKYEQAIAAFHALGEDDHPDVANYIGYAERKLGHYQASKDWYEVALASNPNHVRTWQYYGMWHVEQGNMLKAQDFLEKIHLICGNTTCQEYLDLKGAMEGTVSY